MAAAVKIRKATPVEQQRRNLALLERWVAFVNGDPLTRRQLTQLIEESANPRGKLKTVSIDEYRHILGSVGGMFHTLADRQSNG